MALAEHAAERRAFLAVGPDGCRRIDTFPAWPEPTEADRRAEMRERHAECMRQARGATDANTRAMKLTAAGAARRAAIRGAILRGAA